MQNHLRRITVISNTAEQFEAAAKAGFWGVDLTMAGYARRDEILSGVFEKELQEKFRILNDLGLKVGQSHLTTYSSRLNPEFESYFAYFLPILQKEIELNAQLGCHTAVMHPYHNEDGTREQSRIGCLRLIEALVPTLERCNVTLALENVYGPNYSCAYHDQAEDLLYYKQYFPSDYIGFCLDTGHACIREQDPVAMALAYGKHLKALHVHGSFFRQDNHAIPATTNGDTVDWNAFCDALDEIGFEGNFNLEVKPCRSLPKGALPAYYQLAYAVAENLLQRSSHV